MFRRCINLGNLDFTGFNNVRLGDTRSMFENCVNLEQIYCDGVTSDAHDKMFYGCEMLSGSEQFDQSKLGVEMASTSGYFIKEG